MLAGWTADQDEPWILLTDLPPYDLPPDKCEAGFCGGRSWIEHGFCLLKSLGLKWEQARIEEPARSQRRWLVVARACLYAQAAGSRLEDLANEAGDFCFETPGSILPSLLQPYDLYTAGEKRKIRVFQLGALWIKLALIGRLSLPPLRPIETDPLPVLEGLVPVRPVLEAPL